MPSRIRRHERPRPIRVRRHRAAAVIRLGRVGHRITVGIDRDRRDLRGTRRRIRDRRRRRCREGRGLVRPLMTTLTVAVPP